VEEGLAVVKGVRDRHRGDRRNPWDEFECGHHYARSLASYGLLTALGGFSYSAPEQRLGFSPRISPEAFGSFFSVGSGWGTYGQSLTDGGAKAAIKIEGGSLTLRELTLAAAVQGEVKATTGDAQIAAQLAKRKGGVTIVFPETVTIRQGETLVVEVG